jgi:hypothetical protein
MHTAPSFAMPNPGSAPDPHTNFNYQVPYSIVAYTAPIPLLDSSVGFLLNQAYHNMTQYNTYDQPIDMTPAQATVEPCVDPNILTNQLATILRELFGIEPKGRGHVYQKSYPNYYNQLIYSRGYRVSEFSKFSEEDGKTTLEYVGQFILQCVEASVNHALKLRMFPLSLSSTTFT